MMFVGGNRAYLLPRATLSDERGQAIAEFTVIAITFFFVLLLIIQLAMIFNAFSLVRYAAYNSARAAIVHSGDTSMMREAARLSLIATSPRHGRADQRRGFMDNYLAAKATDGETSAAFYYRGKPITDAQIINRGTLGCSGTVTFDDPDQADCGVITVQVVHQYELVIPLVNRMMYWLYNKMELGGHYSGESLNYIAGVTDKMRRTGEFHDIEYRIPLIAHYTMRLQSDLP